MSTVYNDALHEFVESYMKIKGAEILEKNDDYFVVRLADGTKDFYTYLPRIAAENKEFKLLARGSKWLVNMINECNWKSSYSEVEARNTERCIKNALEPKKCCDSCPFSVVCESHEKCCRLCYYYKSCNSIIGNAEFVGTSGIKKTEKVDLIMFVFFVEISNDYSLSQKISKTVSVLLDLNTGEVIDDILLNNINYLDLEKCNRSSLLDMDHYPEILKKARNEASKIVSRHLEVFRKNIQDVLGEKINSIISKFEEDYIDNYTTSSLSQLNAIQEEGLKLCEREIRGYTINCDYQLQNVSILHAERDTRDIVLRHFQSGRELTVEAEVFLAKVDLNCHQCGIEISEGVICDNGHILCQNCADVCSICEQVICDICDKESYICATCGDIVCGDCSVKCQECDSLQCKSHIYKCDFCGEDLCVDCYEICKDCDKSVCKNHYVYCEHCGEPVCEDDMKNCSICGRTFCSDHVEKCRVCNEFICDDDTHYSAYSGRTVCDHHIMKCDVCNDTFASDEIIECAECKEKLCPNHVKLCNKCSGMYCSAHVNYCSGCGNEYCDCTSFVKCKFCGEEYCECCIDKNGYCRTCSELEAMDADNAEFETVLKCVPEITNYKKFYVGRSKDIRVLYARGFLKNLLVVFNAEGAILSTREVSFLENLKRKNKIIRRG